METKRIVERLQTALDVVNIARVQTEQGDRETLMIAAATLLGQLVEDLLTEDLRRTDEWAQRIENR